MAVDAVLKVMDPARPNLLDLRDIKVSQRGEGRGQGREGGTEGGGREGEGGREGVKRFQPKLNRIHCKRGDRGGRRLHSWLIERL